MSFEQILFRFIIGLVACNAVIDICKNIKDMLQPVYTVKISKKIIKDDSEVEK